MRTIDWAYSAAALLLITASSASGVQAEYARAGAEVPWWPIFRSMLPSAGLWTLAAPLFVEAARRRPIVAPHRLARVAMHATLGVIWIIASTIASRALSAIWRGWPAEGLVSSETFAPTGLLTDLLLVGALVALGLQRHARQQTDRLERERLRLTADNARLQAAVAGAELHALRARLQPHFLFNALGAVGTLVRRGDGSKAIALLAGLGDLLRAAVQSERAPMVPLDRELELGRQYLEVQRTRFGEALSWSIDASDAARVVPVPCLILQPLLENAVIHGVERSADRGRIHVETRLAGGRLRLSVVNDGPALTPVFDLGRDAGEGLRLTIERLRLCAPDANVTLVSTDRGVRATIDLPAPAEIRCAS